MLVVCHCKYLIDKILKLIGKAFIIQPFLYFYIINRPLAIIKSAKDLQILDIIWSRHREI